MKKLISVLAAIGALAFASSASAGEVSANANPGIVKVNGDVNVFGNGTFRLEVTVDAVAIFSRTINVTADGTSYSEFDPGILSYDVSTAAGILDFTLRLRPGGPKDSDVVVSVELIDDIGGARKDLMLTSPGRLNTTL